MPAGLPKEPLNSGVQVIVDLRAILRDQFLHCLDFHDGLFETIISAICLAPFVCSSVSCLAHHGMSVGLRTTKHSKHTK